MLAQENLKKGNIQESLSLLEGQIRNDPSNAKLRIFLFQLLCIRGDWNRALTQLNVAADLDTDALIMAKTYRDVINSEVFRAEVFAGNKDPLIFGQPDKWVALLIQAIRLLKEENYTGSQQLRSESFEDAPATSGTINGDSFEWIADADSRLGPILEVIMNGRYYWVPFQHIRRIHIEKPVDLRDLAWAPASFTWTNGGETVGFIPTRYPDSHLSSDSQISMARRTDWIKKEEGELYYGLGQRLLTTDKGEYPLMDIRGVDLE